MINTLKTMIRDEKAATMVEYGLLVALIALVAIVGVTAIGVNLNTEFAGLGHCFVAGQPC
jgi:pilus assembly protein Flp/PilA